MDFKEKMEIVESTFLLLKKNYYAVNSEDIMEHLETLQKY